EATICLTGETGTGKEVMARHLHRLSGRAERPFIVVDCGALPESLIESELFGHEQGAFTGASRARRGRLREADGGTVLLDEIAEVPLTLQPRLLRFLQHQVVHPIGGQPVPLDVRIVCATHRDLEEMVAREAFRQDLYYRLAVLTIEVPALRQRGQDVLLLAEHFLARCQGDAEGRVRGFTHEAREALRAHSWPGNVRELEHRIQRGILLAAAPFITHLDLGLGDEHEDGAPAADVALDPLPAARAQANARFERAYLEQALSRAEGSVSRAATLAGVSRQVIHALIKRHGIERGRFERSDRPRLDV
ncbi:MAG: sigma-54 dependent transcriptional regulator, partial [Acidobacteriota bacterium]